MGTGLTKAVPRTSLLTEAVCPDPGVVILFYASLPSCAPTPITQDFECGTGVCPHVDKALLTHLSQDLVCPEGGDRRGTAPVSLSLVQVWKPRVAMFSLLEVRTVQAR